MWEGKSTGMKRKSPLLLSALALALAGCSSPLSDPLGDARAAMEAQDYLAARDHAQAALREAPEDTAALELLARAQLAMGHGADARATLQRLQGAGGDAGAVKLLLAEAQLQTGDAKAAMTTLGTPDSAEGWRLAALAAGLENKEREALAAFARGRQAAGDKGRLYAAEASFHLARGNADAAREAVGLAQQAAPRAIETLFITARLAQLDGNSEIAGRAYNAILAIAPLDRPALLGAIYELGNLDRIDLVRPLVARGREAYPGDVEFLYLDARVKAQDGQWQAVRELLQAREADIAGHPEARGLYAEALLELGQAEAARSLLAPLYRRHRDTAPIVRAYARTLAAVGNKAEAARVIAPLAQGQGALPADVELARSFAS